MSLATRSDTQAPMQHVINASSKPKPEAKAKAMAMEILTSAIVVEKEMDLKSLVLRKRIDASSRVSRLGT